MTDQPLGQPADTQSAARVHLRALERDDLRFVHGLNNNRRVMRYWFEEPYESFVELEELYLKHIHDQSERRFIIQTPDGVSVGLVELVEITYIHRRAEFQIIIAPTHQGQGFSKPATLAALDYAFRVLNLHKVYLIVATENPIAVSVYEDCGFKEEGRLHDEFFVDGAYQDALRMYQTQPRYLAKAAGAQKNRLRPVE
ncbi:MAG: spermidine N1-acetyltransferase [Hyphomonadaceae bacterium]|nr:spermidine N1-acetyltransferase [Hyphomonadaceae bacterium]